MVRASRWRAGAWWAVLRNAFSGPQVAAFLPALMLGAYWFGGEGVLLIAAVVFPAVFAFFIVFARNQTHAAHRDPVTGLPRRDRLIQALGEGLTGRVAADEDARIALITEIDGFDRFRELYGETGAVARASGRGTEPRLVPIGEEHPAIADVRRLAATMMTCLGLRDVYSLDLRLEDDNTLHLIEFEVAPGLPCFDFRAYCRDHWAMELAEAMAEAAVRRIRP